MKNKVVRLTLLLLVFFFLGYYIFLHVTHHDRHSVDKILIVDCQKTAKTHTITITKDSFNPQIVIAKICDRVIFENTDSLYHKIAFGEHDEHLIYPGFTEVAIKPQGKNEANLQAYGTYKIHDHFYDHFEGKIIVK